MAQSNRQDLKNPPFLLGALDGAPATFQKLYHIRAGLVKNKFAKSYTKIFIPFCATFWLTGQGYCAIIISEIKKERKIKCSTLSMQWVTL